MRDNPDLYNDTRAALEAIIQGEVIPHAAGDHSTLVDTPFSAQLEAACDDQKEEQQAEDAHPHPKPEKRVSPLSSTSAGKIRKMQDSAKTLEPKEASRAIQTTTEPIHKSVGGTQTISSVTTRAVSQKCTANKMGPERSQTSNTRGSGGGTIYAQKRRKIISNKVPAASSDPQSPIIPASTLDPPLSLRDREDIATGGRHKKGSSP